MNDKHKKLLLGATIVLGLVAVAFVVYWFAIRKPSNGPSPPTPPGPGPSPGPGTVSSYCSVSDYGPFSDCSSNCNGVQFSTRSILNTNDFSVCPDLVQSRPCNNDDPLCGRVQDCVPGIPNENNWSGCPTCLPPSIEKAYEYQYVTPLQYATNGGAECTEGDIMRVRPCGVTVPCDPDQNCELSEDSFTTPCSATCGGGVQYTYHTIKEPASGDGQPCDWNMLVTEEACNLDPCPPSCDVFDNWGPPSQCDALCGQGLQYRTREPTGPNDKCPLIKFEPCFGPKCISTDGDLCVPPSSDLIATACYETCAGLPNVEWQWTVDVTEEGRSFKTCSVTSDMIAQVCGTDIATVCPNPVDCQVSEWSEWSGCSINECSELTPTGGFQVRSRQVTVPPIAGGTPCGLLTEIRPCNNTIPVTYYDSEQGRSVVMEPQCTPQDCEFSDWYPLGKCSVLCGTGTQVYTRSITKYAAGGAPLCPTDPSFYMSVSSCDMGPCIDCKYSEWTDQLPWGPCSASGPPGGIQQRGPRSISVQPGPGGKPCDPAEAYQFRDCCTKNGECDCPLGCNGLPCSGRGYCEGNTCVCTVSNATGAMCEILCPSGYEGQICNGRGTCSPLTGGTCSCFGETHGSSCELGGSCLMHFWKPAGSDPFIKWSSRNAQEGFYPFCANLTDGFDIDTCLELDGKAAPWNVVTPGALVRNPIGRFVVATEASTLSCSELNYVSTNRVEDLPCKSSVLTQDRLQTQLRTLFSSKMPQMPSYDEFLKSNPDGIYIMDSDHPMYIPPYVTNGGQPAIDNKAVLPPKPSSCDGGFFYPCNLITGQARTPLSPSTCDILIGNFAW